MTNEAMNLLARALKDQAQLDDVAIIVLSHVRKSSGASRASDQNDIKHGGELVDTARVAMNVNELDGTVKAKWSNVREKEELDSVRFAMTTKTNIGKKGRRFYYRLLEHQIRCEDGSVEKVGIATRWSPPDIIDVADMTIWPAVKERLEKDFVYASSNSSQKPRLKDIIEEVGGEHDGTKVGQAYIDRGMVKVVEEKNPASKSRKPVQRAVVGDEE